jgi:mannose-6-phosphate isomerase-like protein (cupin superfamily)
MRVCEALGISVASLFESSVAGNVVRGDDYPAINFGGEELAEFLLTPPGEQRLQAILSEIGPGGGSGDELYALPDEVEVEFAFVLEGRLAVRLENEELLLEQGDALTFPGYTRHSFHNPDSIATARVLWVLAPALSRATAAARQSSSITNRPAPTRSVT